MSADMAFALFIDSCSGRYAHSAKYRRKLERERTASKGSK